MDTTTSESVPVADQFGNLWTASKTNPVAAIAVLALVWFVASR